jgi:hypothetical protein
MSYLVFLLGLLLAICGAASISFGYGIINVERGWASFIAGAAALSGGVVTIALALILQSLSRLRALLVAERDARAKAAVPPWIDSPVATAMRTAADSPAMALAQAAEIKQRSDEIEAGTVEEDPSMQHDQGYPAAVATSQASIEDIRRVVADSIKRKAPEPNAAAFDPPAPPGDWKAPEPVRRGSFGLPRAIGLKDIAPQHFSAPIAPDDGRRGTETACAPVLRDRPPAPLPERRAEAPKRRGEDKLAVIGRYESEGTSYVMFADGSIDAHSESGAFHFSTMAELKAFMDAQAQGEA